MATHDGEKPGPTIKRRGGADEALAIAVAEGKTLIEAAATAGVSEKTANRRNKEPEFQARVRELRAEMGRQAVGGLASRLIRGTERLGELMESQNEQVALGAVRALFEHYVKIRDQVELAERLQKVEEALGLVPGAVQKQDEEAPVEESEP